MNFDWYLSHVFTDEEGALQVVATRRLRPDARRRIEQAQKLINEYHASENVINALLENRNEILFDIIDLTKNYQQRALNTEILMNKCLSSVSRHLANTCSLFMSLIEHFNRYYKTKYGRKSIQCVRWLDLQNYQLNNSVEYRLMYGIRGYIQHVDMPPIEISIKEKADDDSIEFSIELDIEKLKEDKQFEKELKIFQPDIKNKISIVSLLNAWSDCVSLLVDRIKIDLRRRVIRQAYIIAKLRSKLCLDSSGRIAVIPIPRTKIRPEKLSLKMSWLPEEKARSIIAAR